MSEFMTLQERDALIESLQRRLAESEQERQEIKQENEALLLDRNELLGHYQRVTARADLFDEARKNLQRLLDESEQARQAYWRDLENLQRDYRTLSDHSEELEQSRDQLTGDIRVMSKDFTAYRAALRKAGKALQDSLYEICGQDWQNCGCPLMRETRDVLALPELQDALKSTE